ncbi:nitroreductase family deazaflavin-dependent oxidoreductase [Prauserella oleivorans]|uniref:Nitroreductase family deazaflavin-dependent oxidoreductase n=1 Tax=Prauserella oleivorans TaxID=1478153 RepID=A0ABW5W3S3_9PSEU
MTATFDETRYLVPAKSTDVFNRIVQRLTKLGISLFGSRVLSVRGRKTGEWRSVPVNLLTVDGERYLVAPRGHTQWVRNLRVAGEGRLRVGRRVETFRPVELTDDEKPPIIHAYLTKWAWETGAFFEGIDAKTPLDELRRVAPGFPVFRL